MQRKLMFFHRTNDALPFDDFYLSEYILPQNPLFIKE